MRLPEIAQRFYKGAQLVFTFDDVDLEGGTRAPPRVDKTYAPSSPNLTSPAERPIHLKGRDHALEAKARELLRALRADKLAREIRVEWNPRLRTCAGRADYHEKLISLNPRLRDFVAASSHIHSNRADVAIRDSRIETAGGVGSVINEIDRTLRHELAHLLAQWRVGRRRIAPHGIEWRRACRDLGVADEARCHNLPFATKVYAPRYVYVCPNCKKKFPRVRRIRRAIACLSCCRKHNGGDFDPRFRLKLCSGGL